MIVLKDNKLYVTPNPVVPSTQVLGPTATLGRCANLVTTPHMCHNSTISLHPRPLLVTQMCCCNCMAISMAHFRGWDATAAKM